MCGYLGMIALMWVAVWQILVTDSPEEDCHISTNEKIMICESLKEDNTSRLVNYYYYYYYYYYYWTPDRERVL